MSCDDPVSAYARKTMSYPPDWRHAGHTKYCLEAFRLLAGVNATATSRIAHEVMWCRFINSRGGAGNNISVDLHMEHINRTLKDYLLGLGANLGEKTN